MRPLAVTKINRKEMIMEVIDSQGNKVGEYLVNEKSNKKQPYWILDESYTL